MKEDWQDHQRQQQGYSDLCVIRSLSDCLLLSIKVIFTG